MRYADGPTTQAEVLIEAPTERVWELVSDIELPTRFSSELQGASWLDGAGPAVGARFTGRSAHIAAGEWETVCVVTVFERGRAFEWAVGDPAFPSATWRFDLVEEDGRVRLRQTARLGPAPSGLTPAIEAMPDKEERIVARRLEEHRANMHATLEGVKALAEAAATTGGGSEADR
jgi:uncharacterized protein YndB with AHSA1/START domain